MTFQLERRSRSIVPDIWYMRLYDRKVDKVMIRDLVNITLEEINDSVAECVMLDNMVVMYLQNNGDRTHKLNSEDIDVWLNEDIDD